MVTNRFARWMDKTLLCTSWDVDETSPMISGSGLFSISVVC